MYLYDVSIKYTYSWKLLTKYCYKNKIKRFFRKNVVIPKKLFVLK